MSWGLMCLRCRRYITMEAHGCRCAEPMYSTNGVKEVGGYVPAVTPDACDCTCHQTGALHFFPCCGT